MTRKEVLSLIVKQAQANGFSFRKWFQGRIDPQWLSFEAAIELLMHGQRYYALLFSHEFAQAFWKTGAQINFIVPATTYIRQSTGGKTITVNRKAFTRRTLKPDTWRYHLREMAAASEPLRYIRRFLITKEALSPDVLPTEETG